MVPAFYVFFALIRKTDYFGARDLVPVLLLFAVLSVLGTHFGSVFMTVGKTAALGASTLIGAAVTVAASIFLIHSWGLFGIALALVAGAMVTMMLRFALSRRRLEYSIAGLPAAALVAAYVAVSFVCYLAAEFAPTWVTLLIAVSVPCACAWPFLKSLRAIKEIPDEIEN
jgi:O-antigen/teichoic acid export membrane protein